ncbi:MAG: DUF4625 domain-containing protein [Chitinophagaceae bacterium]|nr:MAG: DUF4625 domain-containing protein [Chitinophagaceae bacterium]
MKSFLFLLACVVMVSCSEKENNDKEAPVVTLSSPTNNQVVSPGELRVKGMVTDNSYISQIHVEVHNAANAEVLHVHIHPTSKSYALDQPVMLQAGVKYKIKVIVDDPSANTTIAQVDISCN